MGSSASVHRQAGAGRGGRLVSARAALVRSCVYGGLAALALACAPGASAQEVNPFQRLEDCVVREATRLEVSRESAEAVAEAAVAKCGLELNAATPEAGMMRSNATARATLKDSMRETALVQIVEIRTARYTPAPKPAPKPKKKTNP
jgi:hypothetical protein